jgi:hypothetical protein
MSHCSLPKHDLQTLYYHILWLLIIFTFSVATRQYIDPIPKDLSLLFILLAGNMIVMYILGLIAGIMMARNTAAEEIEDNIIRLLEQGTGNNNNIKNNINNNFKTNDPCETQ